MADSDGSTLAADFTSSFATESLAVIGVVPTDGSANQSVNTAVMVQFNSDMDPTTINSSTLSLTDNQGNVVATTVTYDAGTETATLTPTAPLSNSTSYTLDVVSGAGGVADLNGNTLAADFTSSFTTSAPLSVVAVTPADGSTDVPVTSAVTVQFDNPMDASTVSSSTVTLTDGQGNVVAATVTYDAGTQTATLTPSSPLAVSTTYTLTVIQRMPVELPMRTAARSPPDFTSSFSTAALSVIAVTPTDGSADQSVNTAVMVQFNSNMDPTTINSSTLTLTDNQGNVVATTVTYDAGTETATLTPTAPLSNSTSYTLDVVSGAGGVADLNGNTLAADFTSSFTTSASLSVVVVTPANGSTNQSVNTPVTVQFNNPMDASTISTSTVVLTDSQGNVVAATVTYDAGSQTATLTPSAPLSNSTTYTLTVSGGAGGVADTDGDTLAADFTSTFTTAATTPAAPTGLAVDPSSNTGAFDGNGYVSTDTPTLDATAPTGSTVQFKLNGIVIATGTETSPGSGQYTAMLPAGELAVGDNSITAVASNSNGTSPDSTALTVTYAPDYSTGLYIVPGAPGTTQQLAIDWASRSAWYNDEVGYFIADSADGSVNGIAPGSPGYAQAGVGSSTAHVLFAKGSGAGDDQTITVQGGQVVVFYMIQNNTTANFLAKNPGDADAANNQANKPLAFFSVQAANPDGKQHTQIIADPTTGQVQYNWEDLVNLGDADFNDVVMTVGLASSPSNTVATLHAPGAGDTSVTLTGKMVAANQQSPLLGDFGVFFTDDAAGTNGSLQPGDSGYAAAALASGNFQVLFSAGDSVGASQAITVPAGEYLGFYEITNGSTADFLASNSSNSSTGSSVALFSFDAANPDGAESLPLVHARHGRN